MPSGKRRDVARCSEVTWKHLLKELGQLQTHTPFNLLAIAPVPLPVHGSVIVQSGQ